MTERKHLAQTGRSTEIAQIRQLEELSLNNSAIHRVGPLSKLAVTLIFIIAVISCGKYDAARFIPFFSYPLIIIILSDTPLAPLLKRLSAALVFILFLAIFNVFLDRNVLYTVYGLHITYGMALSFSMIIKCVLTVLAAMLLICTTPLFEISHALKRLRVPDVFIMLLLFIYRYIFILSEEARRKLAAARLRSGGNRAVSIGYAGEFIGSMILRSFARAERIYNAMLLRGFSDGNYSGSAASVSSERKNSGHKDFLYAAVWCAAFLVMRCIDLPYLLGRLLVSP